MVAAVLVAGARVRAAASRATKAPRPGRGAVRNSLGTGPLTSIEELGR